MSMGNSVETVEHRAANLIAAATPPPPAPARHRCTCVTTPWPGRRWPARLAAAKSSAWARRRRQPPRFFDRANAIPGTINRTRQHLRYERKSCPAAPRSGCRAAGTAGPPCTVRAPVPQPHEAARPPHAQQGKWVAQRLPEVKGSVRMARSSPQPPTVQTDQLTAASPR